MKSFLFGILVLIAGNSFKVFPQSSDQFLEIEGVVELDLNPLQNATVSLYKGNSKINSTKTGSDGIFRFKLDINEYYVVEVSKEKYIPKRIAFDTSIPDEEATWTKKWGFAISVMKACEGVDYSALKEPVDIIRYNKRRKDFDSDKSYVFNMKTKIENIGIEYDRCIENKYRQLIEEADRLFNTKNYEQSRDKYYAALDVYPDENYPKKKIEEINNLLNRQENIDDIYYKTVGEADALFAQKKYKDALFKYKGALTLKPQESYPRVKVNEIESLLAKLQTEQQTENALESQYNSLVTRGNTEMANKNYAPAKQLFQRALELKPNEQTLKTRIAELSSLIDEQEREQSKQKTIDDAYSNAIAQADAQFNSGNYEAAKRLYEKAKSIKPLERYPADRIALLDKMAEDRTRNKELARQAEINNQYQATLVQAENLFKTNDYKGALEAYSRASTLKPNEIYPKQKITQINNTIKLSEAKKQRELDVGYQSALAAAEKSVIDKNYEAAKENYQKALQFKPNDMLIKNKILEIDNKIKQEQARLAAQQSRKKQYDNIIENADGLFQLKEYYPAKAEYQKALQVSPNEQYPRQRIQEIEKLLAEQQKQLAEQQAFDNSYKLSISRADELFIKRQFELAKSEYNKALSIKPNEFHPKNRISQIDNILAEQNKAQQIEENYKNTIAEADRFFSSKNYAESKASYTKALEFKPNETYPRTQIAKIDNLIAESKRTQQEERERQQQYNSYITKGDNYFSASNYQQAKESYQKALAIKPDEQYPKVKINKIDEILELLAQQKRQSSTIKETSTSNKKPVLAELNFKNNSELDKYLTGLKKKYPEGVTSEIYHEKYRLTSRYIIIRDNEVKEFRGVHFLNWGGREYTMNGKPITQQYFESQIKPRSGEYFKEFEY